MVKENNRRWLQNARFLPLVQILLASFLVVVAWMEPYTLQETSLWLGPSTLGYVKNPTLIWLMLGQIPIFLAWWFLHRPKALWQWFLAIISLGMSIILWSICNDPPLYLG